NEVRCNGLKHQKEKRSMDYFAGLDVSVKETSICIVDDTGKIVREAKVASEPEALLAALKKPAYHSKRIGLEAGPLSQWLFSVLAEAGLPDALPQFPVRSPCRYVKIRPPFIITGTHRTANGRCKFSRCGGLRASGLNNP